MTDPTSVEMYENLYNVIPKTPDLWTQDDIGEWLKFIKMEQYFNNFKDNSVDGLLILDLCEEDLKEELKITLKLHLKKIIKAIEILKNYSKYVKDLKLNDLALTNVIKNDDKLQDISQNRKNDNTAINIIRNNSLKEQNNNIKDVILEEDNKPIDDNNSNSNEYIIIKSIEVPYTNNHKISQQGSKIGRHSSNDIVIFDESVSRFHGEIVYSNNKFELKDIGSTTGTFLKIIDPIVLVKDMIIEIGSYQFLVDQISTSSTESYIVLVIYESPEERESDEFLLTSGSSIGRKNNNTIYFQDDMHMSNTHCKFNLIGDKFYFEDAASTNGSWLRLSKENEKSNPIELNTETIFKIGNSAMYQTEELKLNNNLINIHKEKDEEINQNTKCCICWENERDCFIQPCKHNVSCMKCTKGVKNCPICRILIEDMIKIYKA